MTGVLLASLALLTAAEPAPDEKARRIAVELGQLAADSGLAPAVRIEALRTLGRLDADARAAVPLLIDLLGRPTESLEVIEHAAMVLGRIGPPARAALPALARVAGRDIDVDLAARRAADRITSPPDAIEVQELVRELRAAEPGRRLRAAKGLALKGRRAEEAIPDLLPLLRDADGDVRRMAVTALKAVEPGPRFARDFAEAHALDLADADDNVRLMAARSLARLGPAASTAAEALQKAADDPSDDVRRAATEALNKLGPPTPPGPTG